MAEKTVIGFFKNEATDLVMDNPVNWPTKVIAANSMYRLRQTILLVEKDIEQRQTNEELFERLSIMISGILAACFTNLARVKCRNNTIKDRIKSIRQAAVLLGESEEIIQILQLRELPGLDPEKLGYIDEWRAFLGRVKENPTTSAPALSNVSTILGSSDQHASIEVQM